MIKFTFIFIILYWVLAQPKGEKAVNRYITFCAILFIAMMGLRNEAIYGDTYTYVSNFKDLSLLTVNDIYSRWKADPFFWVISFIIQKVTNGNYTIWLSIIAIAFMVPVTKLIRRYSSEPMYSWMVFIFIGLMYFVMAGLRQTVSMSLTLTGFLFLLDESRVKKKRTIWFVCCVILASLFHTTSLICLTALLFNKRSFNGTTILLYAITLAVGMFIGGSVLREITSLVGQYDERYLSYGEEMHGSTYTYLIQQVLVVIPSLFFLRNKFRDPLVATLLHFSIIGMLFVSLSPFVAEMFRLSFYFSWANLIVFPMAIRNMRSELPLAPSIFLTFFIVYLIFIVGTAWGNYYFWFEDTNYVIQQMYSING